MPEQVARGGALAGGSAVQPWAGVGGALAGGEATIRINGQQALGGALAGGSAVQGLLNALLATGGAEVAGEARQLRCFALLALGGTVAGGAAAQGPPDRMRGVGGALAGGAADQVLLNRMEPEGGAEPHPVEGAYMAFGLLLPGIGGAEDLGEADQGFGLLLIGEGGAEVAGEADQGSGPGLDGEGGAEAGGEADFFAGGPPRVVDVEQDLDAVGDLVIDHPAAAVAGDLLLWLAASGEGHGGPVHPPDGFTPLLSSAISSSLQIAGAYKTDSGSEPSDYSATLGPGQTATGVILAIRGWDTLTPAPDSDSDTSDAATPPDEDATNDLALASAIVFLVDNPSPTTPGGWTEEWIAAGSSFSIYFYSRNVNAGTVTGPTVNLAFSTEWGASLIVVESSRP